MEVPIILDTSSPIHNLEDKYFQLYTYKPNEYPQPKYLFPLLVEDH